MVQDETAFTFRKSTSFEQRRDRAACNMNENSLGAPNRMSLR
jgi:hypothetical protein